MRGQEEFDTRPFKVGCRHLWAVAPQPMAERLQESGDLAIARDRVIGKPQATLNCTGKSTSTPSRVNPGVRWGPSACATKARGAQPRAAVPHEHRPQRGRLRSTNRLGLGFSLCNSFVAYC
jgi:hypothetical protein